MLIASMTTYLIVGIGMMATGLTFPLSDLGVSKALVILLGDGWFVVWCGAMFYGGFGLVVKPRLILLWMLPTIVTGKHLNH